jgi:hypothetical protein
MPGVTLAVEGVTDEAVLRKILKAEGFETYAVYGLRGKGNLDASLAGFNNAAKFSPWLVVRDLDHDDVCGAALARTLMPAPGRWMRFRIAVRETEAWLLADPESLAGYLRIRRALIPPNPEGLSDPKQALVNLARKSRSKTIVSDMVPEPGLSSDVGPAYVARVSEFALKHWRPEIAARNSSSLKRCIERVREFATYV